MRTCNFFQFYSLYQFYHLFSARNVGINWFCHFFSLVLPLSDSVYCFISVLSFLPFLSFSTFFSSSHHSPPIVVLLSCFSSVAAESINSVLYFIYFSCLSILLIPPFHYCQFLQCLLFLSLFAQSVISFILSILIPRRSYIISFL